MKSQEDFCPTLYSGFARSKTYDSNSGGGTMMGGRSILINTLIQRSVESLAGIGFTIIGIPAYYLWKKAPLKEAPK